MEIEYLKSLLLKLKNNQCSLEEKEWLYTSLPDMDESNMNKVMEALFLHDKTEVPIEKNSSDLIYNNTLSQLELDKNTTTYSTLKGALLVLAIAAISLLGYYYYKSNTQKSVIKIKAEYAQQKNVELPDGSIITLNANSQIEYKDNWDNKHPREVTIVGEAYFKVKKNQNHHQKFIVHTNDLSIVVHGTEFNVNTRNEKTSVYLEEGEISVQFNEDKAKQTMLPGDKLEYSSKKKMILSSAKGVMPKSETSWKDGVLIFEEKSLKYVFDELESIYGITIKYDESLDLKKQITAGIPMKELDIVIPLLSEVLNREIKTDKKLVTILSK
jgi:transmembrane sensor